jgi:colanic acid biosynthesis glycosyl transferase WcaI
MAHSVVVSEALTVTQMSATGWDSPVGSRPLNIALICHVYPPEHAPAGVMVSELAEDLAANGHRVTVITGWPNHPAGVLFPGWQARWRSVEQGSRGFRVIRCGHSIHPRERTFWRLWYYLTFAISALINGLGLGRLDAILCLSTPVFGSWAAWLLARIKGARFVYAVFDLHPESAANAGLIGRGLSYRVLRAADTSLCRHSNSIVTLSAGLRAEILARGIGPKQVDVVPFWLDGAKVRPGPRDNPWRREQGIAPQTFVALYAGTIGHVSGAEVLTETARHLASRRDILILCVGEGPIKDRLEGATAHLGLRNLRFLPFQAASVLNEVLATADVGLVTLLPEAGKTSVPSKVLGYLAAGRPVIASVAPESDTAKMIQQGACGRVTACLDPAALAQAILELADDPATRLDLGRRGRAYFEQVFDRATCVRAYERLLCGTGATPGDIVKC